jgi:hypothetical protein
MTIHDMDDIARRMFESKPVRALWADSDLGESHYRTALGTWSRAVTDVADVYLFQHPRFDVERFCRMCNGEKDADRQLATPDL